MRTGQDGCERSLREGRCAAQDDGSAIVRFLWHSRLQYAPNEEAIPSSTQVVHGGTSIWKFTSGPVVALKSCRKCLSDCSASAS